MARKVICTVGTSLVENGIIKIDKKPFNIPFDIKNAALTTALSRFSTIYIQGLNGFSAEMDSLVAIQAKVNDDLAVHLICTDSNLSYLCAEVIRKYFEVNLTFKIKVLSINVVDGLRVENSKLFRDNGILNLFKIIKNLVTKSNGKVEKGWLINITGGYKIVLPVLTIIAQLLRGDILYTYEGSNELISLDLSRLPLEVDEDLACQAYQYLNNETLKSICHNEQDRKLYEPALNDLCSLQLLRKKGLEYKTTILGKIFHELSQQSFDADETVFGAIMEYKVFEYFFRNPIDGFKPFKLGLKFDFYDPITNIQLKGDLDLVLINKEKKEFIVFEIKSINQFTSGFNKTNTENTLSGNIDKSMKQIKKNLTYLGLMSVDQNLREIDEIRDYRLKEYNIITYIRLRRIFNEEALINNIKHRFAELQPEIAPDLPVLKVYTCKTEVDMSTMENGILAEVQQPITKINLK